MKFENLKLTANPKEFDWIRAHIWILNNFLFILLYSY
jgi:hypothetical protein